jgi:hypothetical protein
MSATDLDTWWYDNFGFEPDTFKRKEYYDSEPLELKCECGSHATYGSEIPGKMHAPYCPLYDK